MTIDSDQEEAVNVINPEFIGKLNLASSRGTPE